MVGATKPSAGAVWFKTARGSVHTRVAPAASEASVWIETLKPEADKATSRSASSRTIEKVLVIPSAD